MEESKREPQRGRSSSQGNVEIILGLLRGKALGTLPRQLRLQPPRICEWRDKFLAGGQALLKSRHADSRDAEIPHLKAKVGDLTMQGDLLGEKIDRLQKGLGPPARRPNV